MITSENWNDIFTAIKDNFSGEIKYVCYDINDNTLDNLEDRIPRKKLDHIISLKNNRLLEGQFADMLMDLNFSEDEIETVLNHAVKLEGNFPHLMGEYQDKRFIVGPAKTHISFNIDAESDFEIELTTEGKFSSFKKKFSGLQDIVIGVEDFDSRFIIKGNPEDRVKEFLSHNKVRNLIKCFEPIKSIILDKSSLTIVKTLTRSEVISDEKIELLTENLGLLAIAAENPDRVEEVTEISKYKKVQAGVKELPSQERLDKMEKRFDKMERILEEFESRLRRLEGR